MLGNLNINNPGNIRISNDRFLGEIVPSSNAEFKQFSTMAYGYRAMFKIINTYRKLYGLSTISDILYRYAPPSENDTTAYINFVSQKIQIAPTQPLSYDQNTLTNLVYAMSWHENGIQPNITEVENGLQLAEIIDFVTVGVSVGGLIILGAIAWVVFRQKPSPKNINTGYVDLNNL